MIRRKIAKGDLACHNKPHFCFVRTNIIKMGHRVKYGLDHFLDLFLDHFLDYFLDHFERGSTPLVLREG